MKKNSLDMFVRLSTLKKRKESEPIIYKLKGADEELIIQVPSEGKIMDILTSADDDKLVKDVNDELVYEAIPELRSKEVLEEFGCTDNPIGVVTKVFSIGDRLEIATAIRERIEGTSIEKVKN